MGCVTRKIVLDNVSVMLGARDMRLIFILMREDMVKKVTECPVNIVNGIE
jgi:hypothetical protein